MARNTKAYSRLLIVAVTLLAIGGSILFFLCLPTLAPRLLVRLFYKRTSGTVYYTGGVRKNPRLEDEHYEFSKRFYLVPGPKILEVVFYKDGEIAIIHTPGMRDILYESVEKQTPTAQQEQAPESVSQRGPPKPPPR